MTDLKPTTVPPEPCRACGQLAPATFRGRLLDIEVQYYECGHCGYVQTERPDWLDRAYRNAINDSDTGIVTRNAKNARITIATLAMLGDLHGRVVDFAGGYGLLVRMLRDHGVDAFWMDSFCDNLVARGFEYRDGPATLITAFEAFEHFVEPMVELRRMLAIAPNVLLSTVMIPTPTPRHDDWWYYGREHGQHVGLFRVRTLQALARETGRFLVSDGYQHHVFSERPLNLRAFKLALRLNRLVPAVLGPKLESRTWSDHLLTAKARSDRK